MLSIKKKRRISYIPVRLCEFSEKELVLVAVYGFGEQPMLLLTNLSISEKTLHDRKKSLLDEMENYADILEMPICSLLKYRIYSTL